MNLRDIARGERCEIRVPGYCSGDPEQTVLCHVRMVGLPYEKGKAHDFLGAHGCFPCHQVVDGQFNSDYTREERELLLLKGVIRTQAKLLRCGKVRVMP